MINFKFLISLWIFNYLILIFNFWLRNMKFYDYKEVRSKLYHVVNKIN